MCKNKPTKVRKNLVPKNLTILLVLEKVVENKDSHTSDSNEPKVSKDEENKPEKE